MQLVRGLLRDAASEDPASPLSISAIHTRANSPERMSSRMRLHLVAHVLVDHARAARVVAELGRVGDRPAHVLEAALVHQVDDQLQLVEALVVGDLGLVAGRDERLEPGADQLGRAAAEHGLLAEEVGLGLLAERRLEDAGAAGADPDRVGEREVARAAADASCSTAISAGVP